MSSRMVDILIDKIEDDPYPSATMMDLVEAEADEDQRERYGQVIYEKVQDEEFPSMTMIRRAMRLGL